MRLKGRDLIRRASGTEAGHEGRAASPVRGTAACLAPGVNGSLTALLEVGQQESFPCQTWISTQGRPAFTLAKSVLLIVAAACWPMRKFVRTWNVRRTCPNSACWTRFAVASRALTAA